MAEPAATIDELLGAAPTPALRVDAGGKVAFANAAFRGELGATPEAEQAALKALAGNAVELNGQRWEASVTDVGPGGLVLFLRPLRPIAPANVALRRGFYSIASHDLRGLLANVRSWCSILLSGKVPLDERGKRAAEIIARNTDRALSLMQEFFDAARSDLVPVPVDIAPLDVRAELEPVIAQVRTSDPELPVQVETSVRADLGALPVDAERFKHALRGFLEHGRGRAGPNGQLLLDIHAADGGVWFDVRDKAPPPSPAELTGAFDRDARSVAEKKLGTGFRLSFAAAEIAAHGGRVKAEALPDGAVFGFWLPAKVG